jgi:hypothetical protein
MLASKIPAQSETKRKTTEALGDGGMTGSTGAALEHSSDDAIFN